jgi:hypothetical protein
MLNSITLQAYSPAPPEIIYQLSNNKKFIIQIYPLYTYSDKFETSLNLKQQIFIVYKKVNDDWEEISFFRKSFKHNLGKGNTEIDKAIISDDGKSIAVQVEAHPLVADSKIPILYIFNSSGNLLGEYIENELVYKSEKMTYRLSDFSFNDNATELIIKDTGKNKKTISLKKSSVKVKNK